MQYEMKLLSLLLHIMFIYYILCLILIYYSFNFIHIHLYEYNFRLIYRSLFCFFFHSNLRLQTLNVFHSLTINPILDTFSTFPFSGKTGVL